MRQTFSSLKRIKSKREISFLLYNGKRWHCSLFTLVYKINNFTFDRIGILVSRKNGSAVVRNRIKRVVREIARVTQFIDPPCYDILIRPHFLSSVQSNEVKEIYESWRRKVSK